MQLLISSICSVRWPVTGSQEQAAGPVTVLDIVGRREVYKRYGGAINA